MKSLMTLLFLGTFLTAHTQWTAVEMSHPRSSVTATSIADNIAFVSGSASGDDYEIAKKRIDIYNVSSDTWKETNLSVIRQFTFAEAIGNRLYIAGYTQTFESDQDVIEIYDLDSGEWSSMEFPSIYGATSLTSIGNLLVGVQRASVDIFNTTTEEWTSHTLSENRILAKAQGCNDKIYFAGGGSLAQGTSKTIDIYDVAENVWTTDSLSITKNQMSSECINKEVYFIGGGVDFGEVSSVIEKINTVTGVKEVIEIEGLEEKEGTAFTDDFLYLGVSEIDFNDYQLIRRLNLETLELDSIFLPTPRFNVGMVAYDNSVYFAGGANTSLERSSIVDIYSDLPSNLNELTLGSALSLYPNPSQSELNIQGLSGRKDYQILNVFGQKVGEGSTVGRISIVNLEKGMYYLNVEGEVHSFMKI